MFFVFLGAALLSLYTPADAVTECQQRFHGTCKPIFNSCPQGYTESLSYCSFLESCCYKSSSHGGASTPATHTSQGSCGNPTVASQHRIVGGSVATHGAYPWQPGLVSDQVGNHEDRFSHNEAQLQASIRFQGDHICGGTLIDRQWVLTAAHCFEDSPLHGWSVGLGQQNVRTTSGGHIHLTSNIIVHRHYNKHMMKNDIALIKLSKPVDITGPYIRPACLPGSHDNFDNIVCTATGWGSTYEDGDIVTNLREVDVSVIPNPQCKLYMNQGDVFKTTICAGYASGGKDTCQGDSGGPLACKMNNVWTIAGVVSWGYGCGDRKSPGIYTRVSSFLSWIHTQQNNHSG